MLGGIRAAEARDDFVHNLVHPIPTIQKSLLVPGDRLRHVEVDVAVAEVAEGDHAGPWRECSTAGVASLINVGTRPTATESLLMEAPSLLWHRSVTGNVTLNGALSGTLNYPPQPGDTFYPVSESSTSTLSGTFSNLPQNGLLVLGIKGFTASYQSGTGLVLTATAHDVITWIGGASGDWETANNWRGGNVPGPNDDVIIGAGATVTIDSAAYSIDQLTLSGTLDIESGGSLAIGAASTLTGTLTVDGGTLSEGDSLTVAGTLNWEGGTLTGAGITIATGGVLDVSDGTSTAGRELDCALVNTGTVNWQTSYGTSATASGSITNQSGGMINLQGDEGLSLLGASAPALTNAGTIDIAAGTTSFPLAVGLVNTGTLNVESGTLGLTADLTNKGTINVPSGATLSVLGAFYRQSSGTIDLAGTLTSDQPVTLTGGSLTGTGTVQANLSNGGTVAPGNPYGTLTIDGNYAQTSGGTLSASVEGTALGSYSQLAVSGAVSLDGSLALAVHYTIEPGDSYKIISQQSGAPITGMFTGDPEGGQVLVGIKAFTITYQGGSGNAVALTAASYDVITWTGAVSNDWNTGGNWLGGNVPTSNDNVVIGSAGTVTISGGENVSVLALDLIGNLDIEGYTADGNASLTVGTATSIAGELDLDGGSLFGTGSVTVAGTLNFDDGTLTGSGILTIANGGTLDVANGSVPNKDYSSRTFDKTLDNSGTVIWTSTSRDLRHVQWRHYE